MVEVVGAKFKGHDSGTSGIRQVASEFLDKKLFFLAVIDINFILFVFAKLMIGNISFVSPDLDNAIKISLS